MEQLTLLASDHPMLSAAWAAILVAIIFISVKMKLSPIKQISPQQLTFLVNREEGIVVDIRKEKDFKTNHILDSINHTNEKITAKDFVSLEKYKDRPIIVVCAAGMTANKASELLVKSSFNNVSVLKGGLNAWVTAGLPVTKK